MAMQVVTPINGVVTCPGCGKEKPAPPPGNYACAKCGTRFVCSQPIELIVAGKNILLFTLTVFVIINLVVSIKHVLIFNDFGTQIIQNLLTLILFYFLYNGSSWAKLISIILFCIGGAFSLIAFLFFLSAGDTSLPYLALIFLTTLMTIFIVYLLLFSEKVKMFLKFKRHERL